MSDFSEHVINFNLAEEDERLLVQTDALEFTEYENETVEERSEFDRLLSRIESEIQSVSSFFYRKDRGNIDYSDCCWDDEEKQLCKV